MKKVWLTIVLCVLLLSLCAVAAADKLDILKPVWLNALENMQVQKGTEEPLESKEPKVVSGDEQLEVVQYAIYMNDKYSTEAYVYAELKNTGDSIIRLNAATLAILDASGRQIDKEKYASVKPDVIMPGESLFVTEWLYNFVSDLDKVDTIEVSITRSEYSRKKIEKVESVKAYVNGDYLYAELTNTTDEPLYETEVIAWALDTKGKMLDMLCAETSSNLGVAPGSTIIFRKYLEQHAMDIPNAVCEAQGYRYEE